MDIKNSGNALLSEEEFNAFMRAAHQMPESDRKQELAKRAENTDQALSMINLFIDISRLGVTTDGDVAAVCEALYRSHSRSGAMWCLQVLTKGMKGRIKDAHQSNSLLKVRQKIIREAKKKSGEEAREKDLLEVSLFFLRASAAIALIQAAIEGRKWHYGHASSRFEGYAWTKQPAGRLKLNVKEQVEIML